MGKVQRVEVEVLDIGFIVRLFEEAKATMEAIETKEKLGTRLDEIKKKLKE